MANEKYQFHSFLKYKNIAHGVSPQVFGSMKNQVTQRIDRAALARFAESVGITGDIVCMRQIHSGTVRIVTDTSDLRIPETDSLVTNKKHVPIAVLIADCLPVLFYDPEKKVIAASHAGFRGLLNHILENTIEKMFSAFQSNPQDIFVGIGPCIETTCYQVGEYRLEEFRKAFPSFRNIYTEKEGKFYLDLRSVAQQVLEKEGILKEHIEVIDNCTKCDPNFYSYRGGDSGRMMSVMSLV